MEPPNGGGRRQDQAPAEQVDKLAALRAGHRFVVDLLELMPVQLSPTDAILLLAISQANVGGALSASSEQRRFSRVDDPPPDALRRPVSMLAIADSLGLPFETTRRRIRRLAGAGFCEIGARGCIVPAAILAGPRYAGMAANLWSMMHQLVGALAVAGASHRMLPSGGAGSALHAPTRLAARVLGDYVLRIVTIAVPRAGDLPDRLTIMTLHLHADPTPAGLRVRATSSRVGRLTRTTPDTARRRLEQFAVAGLVERIDGCWELSSAAWEELERAADDHLVSARRALATLERLRILKRA